MPVAVGPAAKVVDTQQRAVLRETCAAAHGLERTGTHRLDDAALQAPAARTARAAKPRPIPCGVAALELFDDDVAHHGKLVNMLVAIDMSGRASHGALEPV